MFREKRHGFSILFGRGVGGGYTLALILAAKNYWRPTTKERVIELLGRENFRSMRHDELINKKYKLTENQDLQLKECLFYVSCNYIYIVSSDYNTGAQMEYDTLTPANKSVITVYPMHWPGIKEYLADYKSITLGEFKHRLSRRKIIKMLESFRTGVSCSFYAQVF